MARPKPGEHGDQRHLPHGTARWSIAKRMRLAVDVLGVSTQYAGLLAGADVVFTQAQIAGFLPESKHPATLDKHPLWLLTGDDTLKPYRKRRGRKA